MFRIASLALGKGGIFSARVHPRLKQILRGVKQESNLRREGITRFNKRWRSWAIRQVRLQSMPKPVVLTVDPALMDPEYLATCIHTAACRNIKDTGLWRGYLNRLPLVLSQMTPLHFGYVCWGLGKVQVSKRDKIYPRLTQAATKFVSSMTSHGVASLMWMCRRALVVPSDELMQLVADRMLTNNGSIRPTDFIKVCNNLAFFGFGKNDANFRKKISETAKLKFEEETFAQDFREAVDPIAIVNLWDDPLKEYILERFRKIFITARPNHLLKAYYSAVSVRVLAPHVWLNMVSHKTRGFYTSLAMRHIVAPARGMDAFHKSVSETITEPHRNMFRWGPFFIDIGLERECENDKKICIVLDKQTSFYTHTLTKYTEKANLEHKLLEQVGWHVLHVNHHQWKRANSPLKRKILVDNLLANVR